FDPEGWDCGRNPLAEIRGARMRQVSRRGRFSLTGSFAILVILVGVLTILPVAHAEAAPVHGIGLFKGCASPTTVLQKTQCNFTITNSIDPDTLTITSLTDIVHAAGGDDNAGNILPLLTLSFSGGASCNSGNALCTLPKGAKISTDPTAIGNSG